MRKLIDLDEETFKTLSKLAIDNNTNLKSYIESVLVSHGEKGHFEKIKKEVMAQTPMEKIKQFITELLEDKFYIKKEQIDWHEELEYVPLDYFECLDLLTAIEDHYKIIIPDETCESFKNLDEIVRYLDARGVDLKQQNVQPLQ